jgi:hypothetical protein
MQGFIEDIELSPYGGRLAIANNGSTLAPELPTNVDGTTLATQTLLDGAVQIVVPAPSLERLQAIADACNAPSTVEQALATSDQLTDFVAEVEALPENTIPLACAADLIAVAEALQSQ